MSDSVFRLRIHQEAKAPKRNCARVATFYNTGNSLIMQAANSARAARSSVLPSALARCCAAILCQARGRSYA